MDNWVGSIVLLLFEYYKSIAKIDKGGKTKCVNIIIG